MFAMGITKEEYAEIRAEEAREEIARNALAEGISVENVHKITGLSMEAIESIKAEL